MIFKKIDDAIFDGFLVWPGFQGISEWVQKTFERDCFTLAQTALIFTFAASSVQYSAVQPEHSSLFWKGIGLVFILLLVKYIVPSIRTKVPSNHLNELRDDKLFTFLRIFLAAALFLDLFMVIVDPAFYAQKAKEGHELMYIISEVADILFTVIAWYFMSCTPLPPGQGTFQKWLASRQKLVTA